MAKQLGVIQFSGAVGEVVGAKKSSGQKHNSLRLRPYDPKNPRTDEQMIQRIKTKAAAGFYAGLKEILDHSFEGVEYGAPSRNYFMKQAMLVPEGQFPWLKKSMHGPYPGSYLISSGTLLPVPVMGFNSLVGFNLDNIETADLKEEDIQHQTIGWLCGKLIEKYSFLQIGDQLTFIAAGSYDANSTQDTFANPYIQYARVIISTDDSTVISEWNKSSKVIITYDKYSAMLCFNTAFESSIKYGGAVIISRPVVNNSQIVSWKRSTSSFVLITEDAQGAPMPYMAFFKEEAKAAAIASFKRAAADPKSPWYLNQGNLGKTTSTPSEGGDNQGGNNDDQP